MGLRAQVAKERRWVNGILHLKTLFLKTHIDKSFWVISEIIFGGTLKDMDIEAPQW